MSTAQPTEAPPVELADGRGLAVGLERAVVALRVCFAGWMVVIIAYELINRRGDRLAEPDKELVLQELQLAHPFWAVALVALAVTFSLWTALMLRQKPSVLWKAEPIVIELLIAAVLLALGEFIYGETRHTQTLANAWPLAGVTMAGLAFGRRAGIVAGIWLGAAAYLQVPIPHGKNGDWSASLISTTALYCFAGFGAGYLMGRLRDAEKTIASAQAREEVARTLHDGVLQTLAVIQRRSDDTGLASMAREQELELRSYLTGATIEPDTLAAALRHAAKRHESNHETRVDVVIAEELPELDADTIGAVAGAVREALTNASKHGAASVITLYAEPDYDNGHEETGVFCSVKDDGSGFDPTTTDERIGVSRSIKGRMADIGGRAEISGRPGRGAEVRLWTEGGNVTKPNPPTEGNP